VSGLRQFWQEMQRICAEARVWDKEEEENEEEQKQEQQFLRSACVLYRSLHKAYLLLLVLLPWSIR